MPAALVGRSPAKTRTSSYRSISCIGCTGVGWDANSGSLLRRGASRTLAVQAERAVAQAAGATLQRAALRGTIESVVDSGESIANAFKTLNQEVDTSYSSAGLTDLRSIREQNVPAPGLTRLRAERPRLFKRISKIQERANMAIVASPACWLALSSPVDGVALAQTGPTGTVFALTCC